MVSCMETIHTQHDEMGEEMDLLKGFNGELQGQIEEVEDANIKLIGEV